MSGGRFHVASAAIVLTHFGTSHSCPSTSLFSDFGRINTFQPLLLAMSIKGQGSDLPIYPFSSASNFETFLDREHVSSPGIYLKLAKKSAGIPSISFAEATEVALCFGWINGQGKPFDDRWSLSRFTRRRPKSLWSKKNVDTVARLLETGRMRPAGIAAVEAAKADGRWDRAYAGPATIEVPDDFAAALAKDPAATLFFDDLNKTHRYAVLWRIHTASPQNRAKRIETLVKTLADGKVPGRPESAVKPKKKADMHPSKARIAKRVGHNDRRQVANPRPLDEAKVPRRMGLRPRP